ncbi:MAG: hypothetical protein ACI4IW_03200 [Oscillospiraceae bacterium]
MKKYFVFALALALAVLFWGCAEGPRAETENETMPEDFAFSIVWNTYGISSYDSATGRLVKTTDATNPDDYMTTLELSGKDMEEIWHIINNLGMENYPEEYNPVEGASSVPYQTIILSTVTDGAQKEIRCEDIAIASESATKKGRAFLTAVRDIINIIESTDEWQSLPDYEFLYD